MSSPTVSELLSQNRKEQKKAIELLHAYCMPRLLAMMRDMQNLPMEPGDIFQDAVTVVFQNVKTGTFEGRSSLTTYTLSICKNILFYKLRKENLMPKIDLQDDGSYTETIEKTFRLRLMSKVMEELNDACRELLKDFYYQKLTMDEVAEKYGLINRQNARNKKWRCMKRLMQIVKSHQLRKEDFYDE